MELKDVKKFWGLINKTDSCWLWLGIKRKGYGRFEENNKQYSAHRIAYELIKGKIPIGFELDHLCRNRSCVNPAHLEAVTHKENCKRGNAGKNSRIKTHCPKGHKYDKENTYIRPDTQERVCRACKNLQQQIRRKK